jgi:metallo-beta-lactamase family protein
MESSHTGSPNHSATIGFYGGVGSVTGANFLLNTGKSKILFDCGLVQGDRFAQAENAKAFGYDPARVSTLIVSHAHADHIGRIPKLVRDGFNGTIYSTEPTKDLAELMLQDAYRIMASEAKHHNEALLYEEKDVANALSLWKGIEYKKEITLEDGVSFMLRDAGHILGSAFVELTRDGRMLVYTGDIGNVPQPLLDAPDIPSGYQYLIMESVYGDKLHEDVKERSDLLLGYIEDTIAKKSTLIIPAFSLERTQAMLFEINNFVESGAIAPIPVFLDSPLAISVTDVYRKHKEYLKKEVREQIQKGDAIFDFPKLSFTKTVADSGEIARVAGPKIIIAGSGMSHGGRIRTHEKHYLSDPDTTLLLVGYQTVGSVGRLLEDGAKHIRIDAVEISVRARVAKIEGYSGHTDRDGLVDFVAEGGGEAEQVFVTMGEEKASLFLVQRLRDYLGANAIAPEAGSEVTIRF